jgi:protein TonB
MNNTLLISALFFTCGSIVLKSQDTTDGIIYVKVAPSGELVVVKEPEFPLVEKNAQFQGGDLVKFREWVEKNLVYPTIAVENRIQGKVIVQFNIDSEGKLVDAKIFRGLEQSLDNEVLRVVNSSPDWEPAQVKGQPVKQQFVMPTIFCLLSKKFK